MLACVGYSANDLLQLPVITAPLLHPNMSLRGGVPEVLFMGHHKGPSPGVPWVIETPLVFPFQAIGYMPPLGGVPARHPP